MSEAKSRRRTSTPPISPLYDNIYPMTHDELCLHKKETQKLINPLSCLYCDIIAKARTAGYKAGHNDGWQDAQETWENS